MNKNEQKTPSNDEIAIVPIPSVLSCYWDLAIETSG